MSVEYERIKTILDEVLASVPEIKMKFGDVSVKVFSPENTDLASQLVSQYKRSLRSNADFKYLIHSSREKGGSIVPISEEALGLSDQEFKEGIAHEFIEGFFEKDRATAEKVHSLPLLGKLVYPVLRLRIDIKTEEEVERRLGYKTRSFYDQFSDRRKILRQPIKSLKNFISMAKLYEKYRRFEFEIS